MIILHRFSFYITNSNFIIKKTKKGIEIILDVNNKIMYYRGLHFTINTINYGIRYTNYWGLRIQIPHINHQIKYSFDKQYNSACHHYDHKRKMHYEYTLYIDRQYEIPYVSVSEIYKLKYTVYYVYAGCGHDCSANNCVNCEYAKRCAVIYHSVELSTCHKALRIIHIVDETSRNDVLQECIDRYINCADEKEYTLPTQIYYNNIKLASCKF